MALVDSVDKIVTSYFATVTAKDFTYKGKVYKRKKLAVSPMIFRGFTCPANCGACCSRFSLDYLPAGTEPHPYALTERTIQFDGREVVIWSDPQPGVNAAPDADPEMLKRLNHHCGNLNQENGRCGIHGKHPFTCDFELIRSIKFDNEARPHRLTQKLYGRGWAMLRVDNDRGARCEMLPVDEHTVNEVIRKLNRLQAWCEHFHLECRVPQILEWAKDPEKRNVLLELE